MQKRDESDHPLNQKSAARPMAPRPAAQRRKPRLVDRPLLTYALAAFNGLIFLAGYLLPQLELELFLRGALLPELVVFNGEVYRLFTAMFLHGSLAHVLFNTYAIFIVGQSVEPIFGRARFLLIYLLGGLTGSAASLALGGLGGASVGASGAVFAIFAAQGAHLYQHRGVYVNARGQLRHMAILIGINLLIGVLPGSRIDNWGHIGGMLGGAILAWRIAPRLVRPSAPVRSVRDLAKLDSNPLRLRLPDLVFYIGVLIGAVVLVINLLSA